jgi:hypothetical protein
MDNLSNLSKTLLVKPEGLLHLFLEASVAVEILAIAFETDPPVIESWLREAMRKRDVIAQAMPLSTQVMHADRSA